MCHCAPLYRFGSETIHDQDHRMNLDYKEDKNNNNKAGRPVQGVIK